MLPPQLTDKLLSLGLKLQKGRADDELREVLSELSQLPPNYVVRASYEIANVARLGWRQPITSAGIPPALLGRATPKAISEKDLLKINPAYAWLFIFHPSGYVRQEALDTIRTPPDSPFFFAALAWRLNDWVDPVRQAASRCAIRVLSRTDTKIAANAALYLMERLLEWG